jgi:hypothetical protein
MLRFIPFRKERVTIFTIGGGGAPDRQSAIVAAAWEPD